MRLTSEPLRSQVTQFLNGFHGALKDRQVRLQRNPKTDAALERHQLTEQEVFARLQTLTVEDYNDGPLPHDRGHEGVWIWIFGAEFGALLFYIKIADHRQRRGGFFCISFHDAERPMRRPFA